MRDAFFQGQKFDESEHKEFLMRNGLVHRLDKDTSGLMVVAKDDHTHKMLSLQLQQRTLKFLWEIF